MVKNVYRLGIVRLIALEDISIYDFLIEVQGRVTT
jgi:hypothetical protein